MKNDDQSWLIPVHCVKHKIELVVKDAFAAAGFTHVNNLYQSIFYLLKKLCYYKIWGPGGSKSVQYRSLHPPKFSGTKFVSHCIRTLERMHNRWPAIISAFENTHVTHKHKSKTKAKIHMFWL